MKLLAKRNLPVSAEVADDRSTILVSIGPLRFTCGRGEAVHLATQLVAAAEELGGSIDRPGQRP